MIPTQPDAQGHFGPYGGRFVPEVLMAPLENLEKAYQEARVDPAFQAELKDLLENSLIQQAATTGIGEVIVTTLPPDRVTIGADERPQLNLYLYRLTPNTGWRRAGADNDSAQQDNLLAMNLHYLLSAYGERDAQAEVLLGTALQCLQQSSPLAGERIQGALSTLASGRAGRGDTTLAALARTAAQIPWEEIKMTPEFLSLEDLSKLWSSLQAHARLSMAYQVSVIFNASRSDAVARPAL